jgi:predicted nucleotidyltransferase
MRKCLICFSQGEDENGVGRPKRGGSTVANTFIEGSRFKRLNFPDPFGYGSEYKHVFPPRHHTLKAIMDNITDTVSKVYIYGSAIRLDCATDSDLDVFIVGRLTNNEIAKMIRAIPEGETADILVESDEEFVSNLNNGINGFYQGIYERGYKIYDQTSK